MSGASLGRDRPFVARLRLHVAAVQTTLLTVVDTVCLTWVLLCQAEVAAGRQTVGRFICSATPEGDLSYVLPSSSLSGLRFMHLFLTIKFVCLVSGRSGPVPWPCASCASSRAPRSLPAREIERHHDFGRGCLSRSIRRRLLEDPAAVSSYSRHHGSAYMWNTGLASSSYHGIAILVSLLRSSLRD